MRALAGLTPINSEPAVTAAMLVLRMESMEKPRKANCCPKSLSENALTGASGPLTGCNVRVCWQIRPAMAGFEAASPRAKTWSRPSGYLQSPVAIATRGSPVANQDLP